MLIWMLLLLVLLVLLCYGVIACYFVVDFLTSNGKLTNRLSAWAYCIFMVSGIVSPLLPVVLTVGQVNAAQRLEKLGIFSLNAQRITLSGKVRIFCFDKTGTLTKQGLDYLGCHVVNPHPSTRVGSDDAGRPDPQSRSSDALRLGLVSCRRVVEWGIGG